jgi:hypothetical protein
MSRLALIAALTLSLAVLATDAGAATPGAHAAGSCSTGSGRGLGPTYAFRLSVSHTSCRNGRKLIRAYYNCRRSHGGRRGHCRGVLGYRCSERRYNQLKGVSFDARVRCSKGGGRRINHTYTQNL